MIISPLHVLQCKNIANVDDTDMYVNILLIQLASKIAGNPADSLRDSCDGCVPAESVEQAAWRVAPEKNWQPTAFKTRPT